MSSSNVSKDERIIEHAQRLIEEHSLTRVEILVRKNTIHTRAMPFDSNPIALGTGTTASSALTILEIELAERKAANDKGPTRTAQAYHHASAGSRGRP